MDPNIEITGASKNYLDSESGSSYEISSEAEQLSNDKVTRARSRFKNPKVKAGSQTRGRKRGNSHSWEEGESPWGDERPATSQKDSELGEGWIEYDSLHVAAIFEPNSPGDIKSPHREPVGSRVPVLNAKRKAAIPASETRAKRLKGYYSKNYRKLLNAEIHDAASRLIIEDFPRIPFKKKQIGSSIWTAEELDIFYAALSRMGRANVRGIARRISTKSEFEVQLYMELLEQKRNETGSDSTKKIQLLPFADYPSAVEVSEECAAALETTADKLAADQERYEEENEVAKWGDSWLITHDLAKEMNGIFKSGGEVKGFSPAAELFNPKILIELSGRIFMNTATPQEDNWKSLAEEGELPAIRATAFEDFHSLVVSITKRLVQTSLHCTISRQKARNSRVVKHGDVSKEDVDAAVAMLQLPANSRDFWQGCARRNKLAMIDDEQGADADDDVELSYDEVEIALANHSAPNTQSPSQSRLASQNARGSRSGGQRDDKGALGALTDSEVEDYYSSDDLFTSEREESGSEGELSGASGRREDARQNRVEARRANDRANAVYIEALDTEAGRLEEERLWGLLKQALPFGVTLEPLEISDRPTRSKNDIGNPRDWRAHTEYWSPWETLPSRVPEKEFMKNGEIMVRKSKNKDRKLKGGAQSNQTSDSDISEDEESTPSIVSATEGEDDQGEEAAIQEQDVVDGGSFHSLVGSFSEAGGIFYHSRAQERSDDEISFQGRDEPSPE